MKLKVAKERIEYKFVDKGCEKTFTVKGNMIEHTYKCKHNPDGIQEMMCELCGKGGFFITKLILAHKIKGICNMFVFFRELGTVTSNQSISWLQQTLQVLECHLIVTNFSDTTSICRVLSTKKCRVLSTKS